MLTVKEFVALSPHTTFEIGGPARYFVEVHSEEELRDALGFAREHDVPFYVIGGGSNVLIPDSGLQGLVIKMAGEHFSIADSSLIAESGCTLLTLIRATAYESLGGWEKLAGIPGTIGGAVRGNAGAFGPEMKDVVTWVRAMHSKSEEVHEFSNAECAFDYRTSLFKQHPEWIILDVHLTLTATDASLAKSEIKATIHEREKRHIQNVRAAGSFFMNPVAPASLVTAFETEKNTISRGGRVPAGWLIEKAGMKGASLGGAQVSPLQANYLINTSGATAREVLALAERVKTEVRLQFGVALQEEAVVL